jgi:ribosomal protein S18 acetylase RimI-like enzyme
MNRIIIRDARIDDAEMVAKIHVDTWRTAYRGIIDQDHLDGLSYKKSEGGFLKRFADPGHITIIAEDANGRVVGFAGGGRNISPEGRYDGQIQAIYVLQDAQRQGIGRMLTSAFCQRLLRLGMKSMAICVLEENHQARAFYERIGGKIAGVATISVGQQDLREVIYGWDDISEL